MSYKKPKPFINDLKPFSAGLKLNDRIEQLNQHKAFVTLKEHKLHFQNDLKCTQIKPAKPEIGIIIRRYLELIKNKIRKRNISEPIAQHESS